MQFYIFFHIFGKFLTKNTIFNVIFLFLCRFFAHILDKLHNIIIQRKRAYIIQIKYFIPAS